MKGGYKILDFKDTDFAIGVAQKIDGIYEEIEGNYRKPLLLEGLVIDGIERVSRFCVFGLNSESKYVSQLAINGSVTLLTCTIDDEDNVTLTEN